MILLFAVLAVVTTFVIAAVSVGGVVASLSERPRRSVYDFDDAVEFVAETLPAEVSSQVSYDDVAAVLRLALVYLEQKGVASTRTADDIGADLVVVPDDERLGWILGQLDELSLGEPGSELTDDQVVAILEANAAYEASIGVIGPEVDA
jgi:hypothetical protein